MLKKCKSYNNIIPIIILFLSITNLTFTKIDKNTLHKHLFL